MKSPNPRRHTPRDARSFWPSSPRAVSVVAAIGVAMALSACGDTDTQVNQAPVLTLDVGAQESYTIGDLIQIRANADDADDDPLTFSVEGLPERAELQSFPNSALLSWDPISSDVADERKLIFVVEDGRGGRAERVVTLSILAGNGTPRFVSPSSKLFNPSSGQALSFEVEVRDDDSNEVTLSMPAETAPEGASFDQTNPKTGTFSWTPTAAQLTRRVHSATFVADDLQGTPVEQKVTIILQNTTGDNPGGGDPTPTPSDTCDAQRLITHAAPSAQRTVEDYELEAHLSAEGAQKYDEGIVFWTTDNPMKYEVDMESIDMKVGQGLMRAGIPNLLLNTDESATVYYTICAVDSDADPNEDDAFVCEPASYYYSFVAYSPDSDFCSDDVVSGEDFAGAAEVSSTAWEDYRTCAGYPDYHRVDVPAGESAEVYLTYSMTGTPGSQALDHPMQVTVYDEAYNPVQDTAVTSECSGIVYMLLEAGASARTWYLEVTPIGDAEMPYQMTAFHSEYEEPVDTCEDDDTFGSTNRAPDSAPLADDGEYTGLTVCGGASASDWYTNILGVGDSIYLELTVEEGDALEDIYLAAYNSGGGLKAVGEIDGDTLFLTFEATEEDFYYYVVEAAGETRYTLYFITG